MIGFLERRNHKRLRVLLSSYVDGEVSEAEAREVDRHLDGCAECRIELEELQATVSLLSQLPEFELPRSFVLTEAPRPVQARQGFAWTLRVATPVAALILFALVLGACAPLALQSLVRGIGPHILRILAEQVEPSSDKPSPKAPALSNGKRNVEN